MSKVMIAEQAAQTRKRLERILAESNFEVESVGDGRALLERLESAPPDLLLLDIVMPGMDGAQIIKKLCGRVVVMGERREFDPVSRALDQGASDYVAKPVNERELVVRVRKALARDRTHHEPLAALPLRELHDRESGRIDAREVSEYMAVPLSKIAQALGANYPTVAKTSAAPALQKNLQPIKRSLELISRITRNATDARAWLNNPHPDLGGSTPLATILSGRATAVVTLLENAFGGIPG